MLKISDVKDGEVGSCPVVLVLDFWLMLTEPAAWHSQGQDSQKGLGTSENGEKNTLEICAIATTSRRE
ncbi:hypothetical protein HBH99_211660 [Parastagonospora nodorum]|nr:hypothetical protein HBH99_211660 [Parastagonospora nodorum]